MSKNRRKQIQEKCRFTPFFRIQKAYVTEEIAGVKVAVIEALLKLVSYNSSGKMTSHADTFDYICKREGVIKRILLYQKDDLLSCVNQLHHLLKLTQL